MSASIVFGTWCSLLLSHKTQFHRVHREKTLLILRFTRRPYNRPKVLRLGEEASNAEVSVENWIFVCSRAMLHSASFSHLLSQAVVVAEHAGTPVGTLFIEEEAAVATAVPFRRLEFACGRDCARRALAQLGLAPTSILVGEMRQPLWPTGVVGSITHSAGFCAAAVAPRAAVRAIGIDVERNVSIEDDVFCQVSTEEDNEHIRHLLLNSESGTPWRTLLFSAKESLYKAWFPWTRCWLEFSQASIHFDPDSMQFEVMIHHPGAAVHGFPSRVSGRYRWTEEHVFTAIELTAGP